VKYWAHPADWDRNEGVSGSSPLIGFKNPCFAGVFLFRLVIARAHITAWAAVRGGRVTESEVERALLATAMGAFGM
jgi:hypothetical protein